MTENKWTFSLDDEKVKRDVVEEFNKNGLAKQQLNEKSLESINVIFIYLYINV